jgi:uncharacterized protein
VETPNHVIDHCINVTRIALRIGSQLIFRGHEIDMRLVEAGGLLHDIGRSKTHNVDHAVIGAELLREMGMPEELLLIVERHIGAGIPEDEAVELGLPERHYLPETLEEKIVAYADKLISGRREVPIEVTINDFSEKLGEDHLSIDRLWTLHYEMTELLEGTEN